MAERTNRRTATTPRLAVASLIALAIAAAVLPGAGVGSSAAAAPRAQVGIPAGLAAAIHALLGAGTITSRWAARFDGGPQLGLQVVLSADGSTALVGAPGGYDGRAAYVFHVSDAGSWSSSETPAAVLTAKRAQSFGAAVAISADGTTAVVGAPDTGGGDWPPGAIYVFHVSAEDAWTSTSAPAATLALGDGESLGLGLGLGLSSDGTTLVADAPFGGGLIFHASSEDAWASMTAPTAVLYDANRNPDDYSAGFAVAISGDGTTALVSDSGNPSGDGAWLYHVSAEKAWATSSAPTAILTDADTPQGGLGIALALSGDGAVALLGAPLADFAAGKVDVFRTSGAAAWSSTSTPAATLNMPGTLADTYFGLSVAVSDDGTTALVSAPGVQVRRGVGYVFRVADASSWSSTAAPTATLSNSGASEKDSLGNGTALSADGATALLGAPGAAFEIGAADVFHAPDASAWASTATPTAILTAAPCVVPRLIGRTVSAAKSRLVAAHCRLGNVRRVHAKKSKRRRVVSQSPPPGSLLAHDAKVNVKIGN